MALYFFNQLKPSIYVVPSRINKVSNEIKLAQIKKPWLFLKVFNDESYGSRLPEHYKKFYWSWKHGPRQPVHYDPPTETFRLSPNQERVSLVEDHGVQVVYPENCDAGLWGGEGVIKGYYHIGKYKGENAKYWWPCVKRSVVYSEILDKYMELMVTERALTLIDQHYGLDFYLLKNEYADINSVLGFKLKREMLLALANQTLYPDQPHVRREITTKYQQFMMPPEEVEWIGLTLDEAKMKQKKLEELVQPEPLKYEFRSQLLEYLEENPPSDDTRKTGNSDVSPENEEASSSGQSWLQKLNPFGKKPTT